MIVLLCLLALAVVWQVGLAGRGLVWAVGAWALPREAGDDWRIESLTYSPSLETLDRGVRITVHPRRLRKDLRGVSAWTRYLPPGTFRHGLCLRTFWRPEDLPMFRSHPVPIVLCLDSGAHWAPRIEARLGAAEFNAAVEHGRRERLTRRKEYIFGHYDLTQAYTFATLTCQSKPVGAHEPADSRQLTLDATGTVRALAEDGIIKARTTGRVKQLKVLCELTFVRDEGGVGFLYRFDVADMQVTAKNMPPWLEAKLTRELRDSLERSLNREKKRQRIARARAPAWVPLDADIDFTLTP